MINQERIVPITVLDLLTAYGTVMKLAGTNVSAIQAVDPGIFTLTEESGNLLAAEPVKSLDFGEDVTAAVVYFVPALDYKGFTIEGVAANTTGETVNPDGRTLYTATLAGGAITIARIGF